ncbi:MAG TPA: hypothetical protein PKD49_13885 [Hyphomicrobium sp.]|nr:hypothetical protein [Hyphomicrobium sp.]
MDTLQQHTLPGMVALCCLAFFLPPLQAWAQTASVEGGKIVAESRFGHGSISAAVRETQLGPQVQLPGGRWLYCRRDCSETLRVETLDFFEANTNSTGSLHPGQGGVGSECGIFGCLEFNWGR